MPSTRSRRCADHGALITVGVALVTLWSAPLRAQDNATTSPAAVDAGSVDPEARRLAEQGLAHFEAGRYADAIADLEASYRITPAPGLLYNLAQAHRLKGDCAAALEHYRRFLTGDPAGNIRELTEARIAETQRCVADATPRSPPPAIAPTPTPAPPPRPAADIRPLQVQKTPAAPSGNGRSWRRQAGVGLGVAAVGMGIASTVFGARASQAGSDVDAIYDRGGTWGPYAIERERSGLSDQRTALALGTAAIVSATVALWLLLRK